MCGAVCGNGEDYDKKNSVILFGCHVLCIDSRLFGKKEDGQSSGKDLKIMFTVSDGSDTFRATLAEAAKNAAEEAGYTIDIQDAAGSSETQMNQIKNAKDADVIICALCDAGTAQQMEALAGDKPIVFINSCPEEEYLQKNKYIYVGSDEAVAGNLQAEYVLNKYASKDSLNIVLIKGESTHSATKGRTKANKATLEASGKTIHYVYEDYADWSTETAAKMFHQFLQTGQPVDAVICNNDSMAVGVAQEVQKAKIDTNTLPILGVDATTDGLDLISQGAMACTIFQPAKGQGEAAVKAAEKLASGQSVASLDGAEHNGLFVWVPFEQVTAENLSQYQ